jgi:hypothetical protein
MYKPAFFFPFFFCVEPETCSQLLTFPIISFQTRMLVFVYPVGVNTDLRFTHTSVESQNSHDTSISILLYCLNKIFWGFQRIFRVLSSWSQYLLYTRQIAHSLQQKLRCLNCFIQQSMAVCICRLNVAQY